GEEGPHGQNPRDTRPGPPAEGRHVLPGQDAGCRRDGGQELRAEAADDLGGVVCPSGHLTYQDQEDLPLKRPPKCELCDEARNFELDRKQSRFIDFQILRVQELPEELPPGQLPQFFDVNLEGDIVNSARPGDRVVLTGIMRAVPDYTVGQIKTRLFTSQIDCNLVEVKGKGPEQVKLTKE